MESNLAELIYEYTRLVQEANALIMNKFGVEDPLTSYKSKEIPKDDIIDRRKRISYSFHGVGCRVRYDDTIVDFDYGPGRRCDGFDVARLHTFATTSGRYENYVDIKKLTDDFEALKNQGLIVCPQWMPSPHLCYWAEALEMS